MTLSGFICNNSSHTKMSFSYWLCVKRVWLWEKISTGICFYLLPEAISKTSFTSATAKNAARISPTILKSVDNLPIDHRYCIVNLVSLRSELRFRRLQHNAGIILSDLTFNGIYALKKWCMLSSKLNTFVIDCLARHVNVSKEAAFRSSPKLLAASANTSWYYTIQLFLIPIFEISLCF